MRGSSCCDTLRTPRLTQVPHRAASSRGSSCCNTLRTSRLTQAPHPAPSPVAFASSEPARAGAPARASPKGAQPRAWSLARLRSRGARLLPSGRLARRDQSSYRTPRLTQAPHPSPLPEGEGVLAASRSHTTTAESLSHREKSPRSNRAEEVCDAGARSGRAHSASREGDVLKWHETAGTWTGTFTKLRRGDGETGGSGRGGERVSERRER